MRRRLLFDKIPSPAYLLTALPAPCSLHVRLSDGKAAEAVLQTLASAGAANALAEQPLLRHNACVFRSGEGALQVRARAHARLATARHHAAITVAPAAARPTPAGAQGG